MTDRSSLRPIVLIGAARSGTKAARDALSTALGMPTVPYDVGYVWRYGNDSVPHDRLTPDQIHPRTSRLVEVFIGKYADAGGRVIEKTVGNTLRVAYVARLVPEARFVHLIRDGVDVVESTRRQWLERTDYRYLVGKLRHFPFRFAPTYGARHLSSLLRRPFSADGRVASWGPRYPGIEVDLAHEDLLTVCARQWASSVRFANSDLSQVPNPRIEVRYEELVANPRDQLARIAEFAAVEPSRGALDSAAATLVPHTTGKGGASLNSHELGLLNDELGTLLTDLGYVPPISTDRRISE